MAFVFELLLYCEVQVCGCVCVRATKGHKPLLTPDASTCEASVMTTDPEAGGVGTGVG